MQFFTAFWHSATTNTSSPWLSCNGSTKSKTKQNATRPRNSKTKTHKMTRPDCLPLLPPPLGCAILFLGFPRIFERKNKNKRKQNKTPSSLPLLPPWGVQSCFSWFFVFSSKILGKPKQAKQVNKKSKTQ